MKILRSLSPEELRNVPSLTEKEIIEALEKGYRDYERESAAMRPVLGLSGMRFT